MVHRQLILTILLIFVESVVEGKTVFGKCLKYGPQEEIPNVRGRDRYCLTGSEGSQYCLFYTCPTTQCNRPLSSSSGQCRYCPGTCSYGGKTYNVGDSLACLDGSNLCLCLEKNKVTLITRRPSSYEIMCNKQ